MQRWCNAFACIRLHCNCCVLFKSWYISTQCIMMACYCDVNSLQIVSKEDLGEFHFSLLSTRTHYISTGHARWIFYTDKCRRMVRPNVCLSLNVISRVFKARFRKACVFLKNPTRVGFWVLLGFIGFLVLLVLFGRAVPAAV